jgi:hypothetical protein
MSSIASVYCTKEDLVIIRRQSSLRRYMVVKYVTKFTHYTLHISLDLRSTCYMITHRINYRLTSHVQNIHPGARHSV